MDNNYNNINSTSDNTINNLSQNSQQNLNQNSFAQQNYSGNFVNSQHLIKNNNSNLITNLLIGLLKGLKKVIKIILIIFAALIVIAVIRKITGSSKGSISGSKNVAYVCNYNETNEDVTTDDTIEIVFEDNGYETALYRRMVLKKKSDLTDEKVKNFIKSIDLCTIDCEKNYNVNGKTELSSSSLGSDTIVIREGNTITVTAKESNLNGFQKLSSDDKKKFVEKYKEIGYKCR